MPETHFKERCESIIQQIGVFYWSPIIGIPRGMKFIKYSGLFLRELSKSTNFGRYLVDFVLLATNR